MPSRRTTDRVLVIKPDFCLDKANIVLIHRKERDRSGDFQMVNYCKESVGRKENGVDNSRVKEPPTKHTIQNGRPDHVYNERVDQLSERDRTNM